MWGRPSALSSPAARFLQWWLAELAGLIPPRLRNLASDCPWLPVVDMSVDGTIVAVARAGRVLPESTAAGALTSGTACRLRIPAAAVAGKTMVLPEAAAETLSDVLRFQIEQETPFRTGDVYSDHAIVRHDRKTKRIVVEWRLAPKQVVDRAALAAERLGLRIHSIGIASDGAAIGRIDFYRQERDERRRGSRWLRPVLAGALGLLVLAAAAIPLAQKLAAGAALDEQLAAAQKVADAARSLRQEVEALRTTSSFVVDRRLARPTVSELLREMTDLLPDDAWLHRLTVKSDEVSIAGLSPSSSALVARIDAHPWFQEVAYRSPTLRRPDRDLEAFDLTMRLVAEAADQ